MVFKGYFILLLSLLSFVYVLCLGRLPAVGANGFIVLGWFMNSSSSLNELFDSG